MNVGFGEMNSMVHVQRVTNALQGQLRKHTDVLQLAALALGGGSIGMYLLLHEKYSLLTFLLVLCTFLITYTYNFSASLSLTFAYLFLLGDIRRVVNNYAGFPKADPLLLVGPLFTLLLALPLLFKARVSDGMSKAVLGLTAVMTLEIINPRQGGLAVGAAGALFTLIPVSWFWVGRQYGDRSGLLRLGTRVVLPLALLASLEGFYQTYFGVPFWQEAWVKHALENGYSAILFGHNHTRPFGFSVNSVEYGTLLMLGCLICFARIFSGRHAYGLLLPPLLAALVLASMRGLILRVLLAVVIMWAVRGPTFRSWVSRLVIGMLVGFGALAYSAKHAAGDEPTQASSKASSADMATSHVAQGLAHPLDPTKSTAGLHAAMVVGGFTLGIKNPLGLGLGITTLGSKFSGSGTEQTGSSEVDISDSFISMGLVGGPLFLLCIGLGFLQGGRILLAGDRQVGYLIAGLFVGMLGNWVPLGQYAAGPFMWFCIGCANKFANEAQQASQQQEDWEAEELDDALPVVMA